MGCLLTRQKRISEKVEADLLIQCQVERSSSERKIVQKDDNKNDD